MKTTTFIVLMFASSTTLFAQDEPSKKLPPCNMLPKTGEVKRIYELPAKSDYKIYDSNGQLVEGGNAEFIDITTYKKGTYFIQYDGKKEMFLKE